VVAAGEVVAARGVLVCSHFVQTVWVEVMRTVEVDTPIEMLVWFPEIRVEVKGQTVVEVSTLRNNEYTSRYIVGRLT
jgi:hypothetical protein